MTRRDMLKLMIAAGLSSAIDPERLLWTPGQLVTVPKNFIRRGDLLMSDGRGRIVKYRPGSCYRPHHPIIGTALNDANTDEDVEVALTGHLLNHFDRVKFTPYEGAAFIYTAVKLKIG